MTAVAERGAVLRTITRVRLGASAAVAAMLGLLPHVLHHVGPLAGAALFAGIGGSLLFGVLGLVLSIPFLVGVRRRCGNWRVPALLLVLFATLFSVSTFVVGPAISGDGDARPAPASSHQEHQP